ncbi:EamA family transporter [Bacillus canaveralius]|uniref:EamA family transporter n=1 Tax=Bacillus canaveralius TaxID=1403243 RepID=A0A2N5GSI6_9BACI|nr:MULTISPECIES: EamA family transporter [Bacillus]PLR84895.1 EamA family transporter [Bacillus sp. V33-4]PLR86731.1 EamA family transporter [Bacillus canaveralius]PLR92807.1 EamA family transporter [Bacillus canaveralius]
MYVGIFLILISATGFGLLPIFALYAYDSGISVATLLFLRFAFAAMILFSYPLIKKQPLAITKKLLVSLFILGGVLYSLQSTFYFVAVQYIPASLAALILYLYPVFVAVLSFFINKEKLSKPLLVSIIVSLFGMVLILGAPAGNVNYTGLLLALGAAIVYSVYIIFGNLVAIKVQPIITSAFTALFASISFLAGGLLTNTLNFQFEMSGWIPIVGIALFSTVIAMFTFFAGMNIIGPTKASILSMAEPVVTIVCSTLLFGENMSILQLSGGIIVLTGALFVVLAREKTHSEAQSSLSRKTFD